jgi:excisionase family DNA binding protein
MRARVDVYTGLGALILEWSERLGFFILGVKMVKAETKFFLTSEAARELDVSAGTIRTWEKEGKIRAERSGAGFRIFREEELLRFKGVRAAERK